MRKLTLLLTFVLTHVLLAQELPAFIQQKISFCDNNLSYKTTLQLDQELDRLENYFISKGLLADKSGTSYLEVYKMIAKQDDLGFEMDQTFELLDTLDSKILANCFYKLLSQEQLSELNTRHQKAAERISGDYDGDASPGKVAQRIVDNLSSDDFDLEFYRVSSLLAFYRIALPQQSLDFGFPEFDSDNSPDNVETIELFLNANNKIELNGKLSTLSESKEKIYEFISKKPESRGIAFTASRSALYETYIEVTEMMNLVYAELESNLGDIPRNIIFKEPK